MKKLAQIVIPYYDSFCEGAIEGLQSVADVADVLIVINDKGVLEDPRLAFAKIVYNEENLVYTAWNKAVAEARDKGLSCLILSGNDMYVCPELIKGLYASVREFGVTSAYPVYQPGDSGIYDDIKMTLSDYLKHMSQGPYIPDLIKQYYYSCVAFDLKLFDKIGLFDETFKVGFGDNDFSLRLIEEDIQFYQDKALRVYQLWNKRVETWTSRTFTPDELADCYVRDAEIFYLKWKSKWDFVLRCMPYFGAPYWTPFDRKTVRHKEFLTHVCNRLDLISGA